MKTDCLIPSRKPDVLIVNKKKRTLLFLPELKESEKLDKYLNLARELENCVI